MSRKETEDFVGRRFTRLVVLRWCKFGGEVKWECRCDCGNIKYVRTRFLRNEKTKSCGCLQLEKATTHGKRYTQIYHIWNSMKKRCFNPKDKNYPYYGGRGIIVCDEWKDSFENFYRDMGDPRFNESLDRINNDKGYSKENCRWSTSKQQNNNRRSDSKVIFRGEEGNTYELWKKYAHLSNLGFPAIRRRINKGMSVEDAFTLPAFHKPKGK